MQMHTTTLTKKKQLNKNVLELHFSRPEGFHYEAGQFVQFLVNDGEKTVPRAYSLCSTPSDDQLTFCVKVLPNGKASGMFSDMNEGDEATIRGPLGRFTCEKVGVLHFVATGVGIAPIIGIIRDQLATKRNTHHVHLIFGVRHETDWFWIDELHKLCQQYPNFKYETALSQPESTWGGLKGRVTDHICTRFPESHYYICGSAPMVKDVRSILQEAGYPNEQIHFEIF